MNPEYQNRNIDALRREVSDFLDSTPDPSSDISHYTDRLSRLPEAERSQIATELLKGPAGEALLMHLSTLFEEIYTKSKAGEEAFDRQAEQLSQIIEVYGEETVDVLALRTLRTRFPDPDQSYSDWFADQKFSTDMDFVRRLEHRCAAVGPRTRAELLGVSGLFGEDCLAEQKAWLHSRATPDEMDTAYKRSYLYLAPRGFQPSLEPATDAIMLSAEELPALGQGVQKLISSGNRDSAAARLTQFQIQDGALRDTAAAYKESLTRDLLRCTNWPAVEDEYNSVKLRKSFYGPDFFDDYETKAVRRAIRFATQAAASFVRERYLEAEGDLEKQESLLSLVKEELKSLSPPNRSVKKWEKSIKAFCEFITDEQLREMTKSSLLTLLKERDYSQLMQLHKNEAFPFEGDVDFVARAIHTIVQQPLPDDIELELFVSVLEVVPYPQLNKVASKCFDRIMLRSPAHALRLVKAFPDILDGQNSAEELLSRLALQST